MKGIILLSMLTAILVLPIGVDSAFAQTTHTINMPTGSASPDAPYFWYVEDTGNTDGVITIEPFDSVEWGNGDTAVHTVTSGTVEGGPDGIFDSGLMNPGGYFTHQFTEEGTVDYFCLVHPWMVGKVIVGTGIDKVHIFYAVGAALDETGDGFDLEYTVNRNLQDVDVDPTRNTLTFTFSGNAENDEFVVDLPSELITDPNSVWVDGNQVMDFESEINGDITTMTIPLDESTEEVVIMGTKVIPEFGTIAALILMVSIVSVIALTARNQRFGFPKL